MYGVLNIALNPRYLHVIFKDLKQIYKIAFRNTDIIEFKTKVDLFSACAKYYANLLNKYRYMVNHRDAQLDGSWVDFVEANQDIKSQIDSTSKALLYCLVNLHKLLGQKLEASVDYESIKYFLINLRDITSLLAFVRVYLSNKFL